jgi:hypothetical protein
MNIIAEIGSLVKVIFSGTSALLRRERVGLTSAQLNPRACSHCSADIAVSKHTVGRERK